MEFKINSSPHLRMDEITKQLFNRNFLSDIQFSLDGKIIFAHSLELMKRSVVFEEQLKGTLGETKLIPITDFTYGSFLEFVRYIYTDECNINDENGIELLKLATKYQVVMLETQIINKLESIDWNVQLFEYCVIEKYDIARSHIDFKFAHNFYRLLSNKQFVSLHPDAVNKALEFDAIQEGVTEKVIFDTLAGWILNYCKNHQISLREGRQKFDGLIRKVRFPTMSNEEIRDCFKKYPDLLTESDLNSIASQKIMGSDSVNDLWISKCRSNFEYPFFWKQCYRDTIFETKFSISKERILHGIRIATAINRKDIDIEISAKNIKSNKREKISFTQTFHPIYCWDLMISFGHSLRLMPNYEYTIAITYLKIKEETIKVSCRNENVGFIYNDPDNSIQIIKASDVMKEICFKIPPE